jgi:nicotinate-nucleotide pyrophosphorylase (carboxylating)
MDWDLPVSVAQQIVAYVLAEDIGAGDITTSATVEVGTACRAEIVAREEGILAGLWIAETTLHFLDANISFQYCVYDRECVTPGQVVAIVEGEACPVLTGERTALNFLQRMSGIATLTARYVAAVAGTKAQVLDTRKTAPGLRVLDKYAVRVGGGRNHRFGLSDGVLIKDNHIRAAGGITAAVTRVRGTAHPLLKVEVEITSLEELTEALAAGVDVVMLDNMSTAEVKRAMDLVAGRAQIEVSGGITLENVRAYAEWGVDFISVGALTHSPPALDFSLELTPG